MLIVIAACFIAALVIVPFLLGEPRPDDEHSHHASWIARGACLFMTLVPAGAAAWFFSRIPLVANGGSLEERFHWAPSLGADLVFRLDGLSLLFSLLITCIGTVVSLYAVGYFHTESAYRKFYPAFFAFMGAMLGVVLSDNLIALFVFWELTSLSSYYLIGYYHERESARKAALQALIITGGGGLLLLAGFLMMGLAGQSFEISKLQGSAELLRASPFYLWIVIGVLMGTFTKSAQAPFHFWLPGAMAAPTPVSAYLHSATMVKAGIYLMARLTPVLGGTPVWQVTIAAVGLFTFALGAWKSPLQLDLKRLLASSTVSGLGLLTFLIGLGSPLALKAMLSFLVVHALYKAALFLTVGNIDHAVSSRDVMELGGLGRKMPWTTLTAGLSAIAMMGLPPALGFLAKEILYESALEPAFGGTSLGGFVSFCSPIVLVVGNAWIFAAAVIVGFRPFFTRPATAIPGSLAEKAHEAAPGMWLGPLVLAVAGISFGIMATLIPTSVLKAGVSAMGFHVKDEPFHFWHGLTVSFFMSLATFALGIAVAIWHSSYVKKRRWPVTLFTWPVHGEDAFEFLLDRLLIFAKWLTQTLQNGRLSFYLLTTASVCLLALFMSLPGGLPMSGPHPFVIPSIPYVLAVFLCISGTLIILRASSALTAIVALGSVGYGVSLFFGDQGAPDLALTQVAVETLSVLLFAYTLHRLPVYAPRSVRGARGLHVLIALAFGLFLFIVTLLATETQITSRLSGFFAEKSLAEAHGHNIVNVILVDFRGLDTMGEITVLGIAALGVTALLLTDRREEKP